jgi:hypothetical protein
MAGGDADGGSAPLGVACGNAYCDPAKSEGCCVGQADGAAQCTLATGCANTFLACDKSAECPATYSCCFEFVGASAQCVQTCAGYILCSPTDPTSCPHGTCTQAPGALPQGYSICMMTP